MLHYFFVVVVDSVVVVFCAASGELESAGFVSVVCECVSVVVCGFAGTGFSTTVVVEAGGWLCWHPVTSRAAAIMALPNRRL